MYCVLAALIYASSGSSRFDKNGVSVGSLCLFYLTGGLIAGLVLGVFRDALQEWNSAFVVSVIAATPISFGGFLLLSGSPSNWSMSEWTGVALGSLIFAAIGMAVFWDSGV